MKKLLLSAAGVMLATAGMMAQDPIYLIGDPQGWDINGTTMPLEMVEDGVYSGTYNIPDAQFAFRFYSVLGDWDSNSIGSQVDDANVTYKFEDGAFEAPAIAGKGKYFVQNWPGGDVTMTVNLNDETVLFETEVVVPEGVTNYWVTGIGGNWPSPGDTGSVKGVENNGVYSFALTLPEGGTEFKIATQGWGEEIGTFDEENNEVLYEAVPVEVVGSGHNLYTPLEGEQTLMFDAENMTVWFVEGGETPEQPGVGPEMLYVMGNIVGNEWNPAAAVPATSAVDGVFTFTGIELANSGTAYFTFINELNESWDVINDGEHRYGPAEGQDAALALGDVAEFALGGDTSFNIADGTYNFVVNFNNMTLTVSDEAGVETIGIDLNAPAVYYNLNGVKVNNPEKGGVYVVKQGNKTRKVVIR